MKYYLIAGEASGDLHGSYLIRSLLQQDSGAHLRFWGGDKMSAAAALPPVKHIRDLAFMGFVEVVSHLGTILKNIKFCQQDILDFQPDVIIFIDYPGFNLRIAEWAKKKQFRTVYYISPQIWAWKENRIRKIKKSIDKMIVILPFEKSFYHKHGMDVDYVGHPLADIIAETEREDLIRIDSSRPLIALLPGSRQQEIRKMLPVMLSVVKHYPHHHFYIAQAPNISRDFYRSFMGDSPQVFFSPVGTYDLLRQSAAALVTSGTATLETALLSVPEIVCYRGHPLSVWLARKFIKIKYISLVNLILDKMVIREFIQSDLNVQNLRAELSLLLDKGSQRHQEVLSGYKELKESLSGNGAAARAAEIIYTYIHEG